MIVLLEGPDGVGKSSLADAISQIHGADVHHMSCGPPPSDEHPFDVYYAVLCEAVGAVERGNLVVIDRLHVGELVYGNILRETDFTINQATIIDMMLGALGAAQMHCWLPPADALARLAARDGSTPDPKSGSSINHARAIHAGFSAMCGTPSRKSVLPSSWQQLVMDEYPDALALRCLAIARVAERFQATPNFLGTYTSTRVILVHENPSLELLDMLVGFARVRGFIRELGVWTPRTDLRVAAAPTSRTVLPPLGDRIVVALTNTARDLVMTAGFECVVVLTQDNEHELVSLDWVSKMEVACGLRNG